MNTLRNFEFSYPEENRKFQIAGILLSIVIAIILIYSNSAHAQTNTGTAVNITCGNNQSSCCTTLGAQLATLNAQIAALNAQLGPLNDRVAALELRLNIPTPTPSPSPTSTLTTTTSSTTINAIRVASLNPSLYCLIFGC